MSGNPSYASTNNYQKFGQWYDNNVDNIGVTYAAWCAAFVSWCANQAGVPSSVVYYHAYCPYGANWFRNQGRFQYAASRGGSYTPKAGDIVYFAPAGSSTSSHVGIVRYVKNGYVYTVEGNTSGQNGEVNEGGGVFLKSYSLSYSRLYGYGIPAYTDNSGHKIQFDSNGGSAVASVSVKDGGTLTAPANPTRYGFNFVGWYCNPELTDPYDYSMKVTYGFTLYAKWEEAYWGANTNLMPVDGLLVKNDFQGTGQYIWPYYNDDGSVTMYNGVTNDSNWSWPSAYMSYENSFDSGNDAYIYVKYNATARFNATIDYLDADGNAQSVTLSQLAGYGTEDLPAGYQEFFVNFGQYAYDQGHLTTADGSVHSRNIKYTKVTYYVVGTKDDYVRLYDLCFTNIEPVVVPTISLQYPTLLLEDEIKMNVYFTIDQDIDLSKMGMLTWTSQPDVVDMATADAVIPGASYNAELGFFGVTTKGIPTQNLGDVVYFCIYVELEDGTYAYSKQVSYSPTTYAYNQLKGTSATAAAKSLYVAILSYGAAAQTYLGHNTDALINANLTDEMKGYVNEYSSDMVHSVPMPGADKQGALAGNGGFSAKRPSISLDGAFSINYYFTPNAEVDGEMTFYYWNAADFAAADVLSIDNATASYAMTNANGVYSAAISGIAAKDIDGALYACGVYTDVNGNTYFTGVLPYSLGFFCGSQVTNGTEKVQPLAAAIAVYGYYAASYFA